MWNAANEAAYGGFNDIVVSGDGPRPSSMTMFYCNANVDTGAGFDEVFWRLVYTTSSPPATDYDELDPQGGRLQG